MHRHSECQRKYMQDKYSDSSSEIKSDPQKRIGIEKQQTTKVRDERIDSVKFWLITLVIAAHVFLRKEFADSTACAVVANWIMLFAMPLFIFISGYFSRKKSKYEFWPSIWNLLEPLIIFQIIALLFYNNSITIKGIITPWYMLWYLLSLICWRLLLQIIPDKILIHSTRSNVYAILYISCTDNTSEYSPVNTTGYCCC